MIWRGERTGCSDFSQSGVSVQHITGCPGLPRKYTSEAGLGARRPPEQTHRLARETTKEISVSDFSDVSIDHKTVCAGLPGVESPICPLQSEV